MRWFTFILASLATFRLSHLFTKERGPFAVFERLRNAMPGGRGSAKTNLSWEEWILTWLGFSAVTLIINQALMFQK